jgi:hypothetical protein
MSKQKNEIIPASEATAIRKATTTVVAQAEKLVVRVADDENTAYDILKRIKAKLSEVEKKRKSITAPLNASLKAANELFKSLSTPLKEADGIIRDKIVAFHELREKQASERQERLMAKAEKAEESGDAEKANELAERADAVAPRVGDSTIAKRWTYKVVLINKVPREYLQINSSAVTTAIREGIREIPGLEIYQEPSVRVL